MGFTELYHRLWREDGRLLRNRGRVAPKLLSSRRDWVLGTRQVLTVDGLS